MKQNNQTSRPSNRQTTPVESTSSGPKKQVDSQTHDPWQSKEPCEEDLNLAQQESDSLDVFKTNICLNNFSIYDNQLDISY
jgi:hypothetical protein